MTVLVSDSRDPVRNFALERELLTGRKEDFLLFYIDSPCVVLGRNQQPEAEADVAWCARKAIPVLRRISGGGAVWHDEGNINWAFITTVGGASGSGGSLALDNQPLGLMIDALRASGVDAVAGSRGEILVRGLKISGTASCVRRGRKLFHGTLLWDADLDAMHHALAGDPSRRDRKVASIPSPVANLRHILGSPATAAKFMESLAAILTRRLEVETGIV